MCRVIEKKVFAESMEWDESFLGGVRKGKRSQGLSSCEVATRMWMP